MDVFFDKEYSLEKAYKMVKVWERTGDPNFSNKLSVCSG